MCNYVSTFLYVLFGMIAGGPVWLFLLSAARRREQRWRVVDSTCQRLGGD
jgi:hypothetical protein